MVFSSPSSQQHKSPDRRAGMVKVIHGANDGLFNLTGVTVASVQHSLIHAFNTPDDAVAFVNGVRVSRNHILRSGDTLEFVCPQGRKAVGGRVWTEKEFCEFFKITPQDLTSWIKQGLQVRRSLDGSLRITETAADEFFRGKPAVEVGPVADVPKEVSTEEAAKILGLSKDTVLKFRAAGLLEYRNAAPPGSSRPVYRFPLESVLKLRTTYDTDEPTPELPRAPQRRAARGRRKYRFIDYD